MLFRELYRPGNSKKDFLEKIDGLARDFRRKHGIGPIGQLGLAVADAEKAAGELEALGAGPFFIAGGAPVWWREGGKEGRYRGKVGIGYLHGQELELLEPGEGSDLYRRFLDPAGGIVLHHLAFLVSDVDRWRRKMPELGYPLMVEGGIRFGPMAIDFAYFDALEATGTILEFESYKLFGRIERRPPTAFYHALGRLQKLSGRRSFES